eukprot:gene4202-3034_t
MHQPSLLCQMRKGNDSIFIFIFSILISIFLPGFTAVCLLSHESKAPDCIQRLCSEFEISLSLPLSILLVLVCLQVLSAFEQAPVGEKALELELSSRATTTAWIPDGMLRGFQNHAPATPTTRTAADASPAPPATVLAPSRQNPFVFSIQDSHSELFNSQYCIATLSTVNGTYALFCATTNEVASAKEKYLWKLAAWLDERIGDTYVACLIFTQEGSEELKKALSLLSSKATRRIISSVDTWGLTYLAFRAHSEVVRGSEMPLGLEHAYFLLNRKMFSADMLDPAVLDIDEGCSRNSKTELTSLTATRSAVLSWYVLLGVHQRFGTPGSRKAMNPVEQIIHRVVKKVNIFLVDIDVRVGKGTIKEGCTMVVTIFDAMKKSQSIHMIRSLPSEPQKLNTLTALLYGDGSSCITLFIPTMRTRGAQLVAFARTCRPKSPFFVVELNSLRRHLGIHNIPEGLSGISNPRETWGQMRVNLSKGAKVMRKDESRLDRQLHRHFITLANKLFSERLEKVAPAIMRAVDCIPTQEAPEQAVPRLKELTKEMDCSPVPSISQSTFLNEVNYNDAEAVFRLQQWLAKIYKSEERLQREQAAAALLTRYLVIDMETTTKRKYKRIANPFIKENYIVLSGARDYLGNEFLPKRYFDRSVALRYDSPEITSTTFLVEKSSPHSLFFPNLDDYDVLVGHNIKFDLLHLWRDAEVRRFLKRGGRIWDTMYAEYLLTGQEIRLGNGAGLESVAKSYGGLTPKLDAVKQAWAEGKETYQIPFSVLTTYLKGDLENTELIFRRHVERAVKQRQAQIINARMDGLLCTTEMEYNGLKTNVELAQQQSYGLMTKVAELRKVLANAIPEEIPRDCHKFFNWSSNAHLIVYFFGGKLKLNTNARESKTLPREAFDRHSLFVPASVYSADVYPKGVFLRPPVHVMGPCECGIVAGLSTEKGTRIFKAYFNSFMIAANLRKSSTILDGLRREMYPVSRLTDDKGKPSALANLIHRRHIFFFAACSIGADQGIVKLFVKNALTDESVTITAPQKGPALQAFISQQVEKYTEVLVPADEENSEQSHSAFLDAQVTIFARDAAFTFQQYVNTDPTLQAFFDEHSGPTPHTELKEKYSVTLADTVATLCYYKSLYESPPKAMPQPKRGKSGSPCRSGTVDIIPAKMLAPGRSKSGSAESFKKKLLKEAAMHPEEWCNLYMDAFLHMGNAVLQHEGTVETVSDKKKKATRKKGTQPEEEDLPVVMRQRRAFVGFYNALPEVEKKRFALMTLVGRTLTSIYDAFAVPCANDDVVEVDLKGKLPTYVPNELEAERVINRFRSPTTRQLQVGEDTLSFFKKTHNDQTAKAILELRGLEKIIGTYYESTEGGTGMVSLVHSTDSCIHHELIHNKTSTGRLASANPNCQNIPKEGKSNLRDMFISRYGATGMCIEADYSQLEVVVLAVVSDDYQMLEDLRQNVDFHSKRVTMMRPDLSYAEVLQRAKKNKEPEFVKLRQQAKIFSFQRQYGAGAKLISQSTGLTQDQVRMLIEKEGETYRGVDVFNAMVELSANTYDPSIQDGTKNLRGHQLFKGMFPVLTGSRYIFTESDVPNAMLHKKRGATSRKSTNFSPTHLKNYPVQGFAGEIVQIMLGVLFRKFLSNDNYGGLACLTNTVHDCVWVDCHDSIYREVAKDVESIMASVRPVMNAMYPEMQITVDFPCDVVAGVNMGVLAGIESVEEV